MTMPATATAATTQTKLANVSFCALDCNLWDAAVQILLPAHTNTHTDCHWPMLRIRNLKSMVAAAAAVEAHS